MKTLFAFILYNVDKPSRNQIDRNGVRVQLRKNKGFAFMYRTWRVTFWSIRPVVLWRSRSRRPCYRLLSKSLVTLSTSKIVGVSGTDKSLLGVVVIKNNLQSDMVSHSKLSLDGATNTICYAGVQKAHALSTSQEVVNCLNFDCRTTLVNSSRHVAAQHIIFTLYVLHCIKIAVQIIQSLF